MREAADLLDKSYDAIKQRVRRFSESHGDGDAVLRVPAGDDGGKERVLVSAALVDTWQSEAGSSAVTPRAERDDSDHLREENELLRQTTRHLEIQMHHDELAQRDARINALQAEVDKLIAEKAELHAMLTTSLAKYVE